MVKAKKNFKIENYGMTHGLFNNEHLVNYNRWIYEDISPAAGRRVLEIGCGTGNITECLIAPGRKVTGIDINKKFVAYTANKFRKEKNVRIMWGDCLKLGKIFSKGSFDGVVMLNVLEHIEEHEKALKVIHSLLSKNGKIAILVPAFQMLYGQFDDDVGHFRRYNKAGLRQLLEKTGFTIDKLFYFNFIGFFGWLLNIKLLGRRLTPQNQAGFFDKFIVPVVKPIEKFIRPIVGQSVVAIGTKKG